MSLENFIYSKHFAFKQNLFSTSKRLLTLRFSGLAIDSLPYAAASYETIDFSEISKLEVPDRTEKDLILHYKKKGQPLTFEFSCYHRALFLIEFYKAQDLYKCAKNTLKDIFELDGVQVFCERTQEEVRLDLTRTCVRLHYLRKAQEDSMLKEFLDITPAQKPAEAAKRPQEVIDLMINLTQIKAVYRTENGFLMILNGSELMLGFQFPEEQLKRLDFFLEDMRSNNEDHCKGFPLIEFSSKPIELKLSYKTLQSFLMKEKACKVSMSRAKEELIFIAFNEESFFEIAIDSQNLINRMPLNNIIGITRQDFPEKTGFSLIFSDKSQEEYHLNGYTRDQIISNLHYLISHRRSEFFSVEFLQTKGAWESRRELKVEGFQMNSEPDADYEADVLKRILAPKREENFNEILKEFTLNLTLRKFDFIDNKVLIYLIEKFLSFLTIFNHPDFLEMTDLVMRHSMNQGLEINERLCVNPELSKKSEEISKKLETFKHCLPLKINNLTIELANYSQICYFLEEILKAITILISNKGFFREFSTNKKEVLYEKFLIQLMAVIRGPHPVLSYLGFTFLKFLTNNLDQKAECLNKYFLINTLSIDFLPNFSNFLIERLLRNTAFSDDTFPIIAALKLAKSWIKDRRESTQLEDLERVFKALSNKESLMLFINSLHIDNMELFSKASQVLLCVFDYNSLGLKLQGFLFDHTVFFLSFFRAAVLFRIPHLKSLCMGVLAKLLYDNPEVCSLIVRIVPKNMINLIKTSQTDLTKWTGDLWEQFFEVLSKDYSTASELWDVFSRNELMEKLENVERGFLKRFREIVSSVMDVKSQESKSLRTYMLTDFPQDRGFSFYPSFTSNLPVGFLETLRFNHQDFYIEYTSLRANCLVGRYYLSNLLRQENPSDPPRLSTNITHVYRFWTELNFAYLSRESLEEKDLILRVMILVARDYHREIKEFSSMGYFLNLILEKNQDHLYLILQLIYVSLTRADSKSNMRLFLNLGGVDKIFLLLARIICATEDREEPSEEFDYTDGKFAQRVCRRLAEKRINSCLFILEIVRALLKTEKTEEGLGEVVGDSDEAVLEPIESAKGSELYPTKSMKDFLKSQIYIEVLCDCFLNDEPRIWQAVLEILRRDLISRELLPFFLSFKGFFDLLLLRFNRSTFSQVLDIVLLLKRLVMEASTNSSQINYFKLYSHFSFDELAEATIKKAIDFFPFMKFFPRSMLFRLFEGKSGEFLEIFSSDAYEVPDLIWTREMRQYLENTLFSETLGHRKALIEYSQNWNSIEAKNWEIRSAEIEKEVGFCPYYSSERESQFLGESSGTEKPQGLRTRVQKRLESVPRYETEMVLPLTYASLEKEVSCGPLFLRVWNQSEFKNFEIEPNNVDKFLRLLDQKIAYLMQEIKEKPEGFQTCEEELFQLSFGLSNALKRYRITNYSNFGETLEIIRHFSGKGSDEGLRFRLVGARTIYRAITLENSGNMDNFLRKKGLFLMFDLFRSELDRVFSTFWDNNLFSVAPGTVKLITKVLSIFLLIFDRKRDEFLSLDIKVLKPLFSDFQRLSLLPVLFLDVQTSRSKLQLDWLFKDASFQSKVAEFMVKLLFPVFSRLLLLISLESTLACLLIESGLGFFALRVSLLFESLDKNTEELNAVIESMALLLKNLGIWAYESYAISNNTGGKKLEISSSGSARKTSRIFLSIHKLAKREKDLLSLFYEDLHALILKDNLMSLLKEYQEPGVEVTGGQRDFLEFFSKDCERLYFIWKKEMREDLKDLLKEVINSKARSAEDFLEKDLQFFREYHYASHLNELILEEVMIGVFNKSPETHKLPNFGYFLKLLFGAIRDNWDFIDSNREFPKYRTNESRLMAPAAIYFKKVLQGIKACAHILRVQQLDTLFLEKSHFLIIIRSLLNAQKVPEGLQKTGVQEGLKKILKDSFFIIGRLTLVKDGIMAFLQSKGAIVGFVRSFRNNGDLAIKTVLFEILSNIHQQTYLFEFLAKFGFLTLFLEFSMKSEVFPLELRVRSLEFLLHFHSEKEHAQSFFKVLDVFPPLLRASITNPIRFLGECDRELQTFDEFWTPRMRKEVWLLVKEKADAVQRFLEEFDLELISLDTQVLDFSEKFELQVRFPETRDELCIEAIFLRAFIRAPEKAEVSKSFVLKLLAETDEILSRYANCLKSEEVSERANRLFHEALLSSCSVLLSLEQILIRNPEEYKGMADAKLMGNWLDLTRIKGVNEHLRIIILEIILISLEIELETRPEFEIVKVCSLGIAEVADSLENLTEDPQTQNDPEGYRFSKNIAKFSFVFMIKRPKVEEIVLLQLLLKCMLKERKTLSLVHLKILPMLLKLLEQGENKSYLDPIIMCVLAMLVKDLEFAESTIEILSKKPYINVEQDFEKIRPRDYDVHTF